MNINGKWYTEPQIEVYVTELENKVAELEEKHWNECRQIAHYSDELGKAKELLKAATGIINDIDCNEDYLCNECEYRAKCDGGFSFYWRYANEALALIGEDTNVPYPNRRRSDDMEYISKDKTLKKLQMQLLDLEADQDKGEYSELCENRGARDALDGAIYDIRAIKGEDVQPVKHGRWIDIYEWAEMHDSKPSGAGNYWWCSECEDAQEKKSKYCPNCGARMGGDVE